ncbi:MAG: FKBP-type peptidyl-prolyl cis-trans isomerase [Brevinema sp.]
MATKAKKGNSVKVHYKGTLADKSVFDSSEGREPLEFVLGAGHVIPGFDNAVEGMEVGEKKTVNIPSDQAYGKVQENATVEIPVGQRLVLLHPETGEPMPVTIVKAEKGMLTLDGNHPLAGKDLTFELSLEEVSDAPAHNHDHGDSCGCGSSCGCDHNH